MMATEDGVRVFLGHPGEADYFRIYELQENGDHKLLKELKNEAKDMEEEGKHGSVGKMRKVLKMIGDVDIILSTRNSPNLIRMAKETEIQPVISPRLETLEEGLKKLVENFEVLSDMVKRRKKGERFDVYIIR